MPKWRSKRRLLAKATDIINEMIGATFSIDVEYRDIVPQVYNGRITREWLNSISAPAKQAGYAFVVLHMSKAQRTKWKVLPEERGLAIDDTDLIGEAYFWADEKTKTKERKYVQFIETFCHEIRHLVINGMDREDDTHDIHLKTGTMEGAFKALDYADYNPARKNQLTQISILKQVIPAFLKLIGLKKRKTLYAVAVSYLGRDASPSDIAPDELGCAESVSVIIRDVLPDFPIITGTWTLNERLKSDPRFKAVTVPMPGTIIISPTGTSSSKKVPNGHVGILGGGDTIMSNDSNDGYWKENYNLATWSKRWSNEGYKTFMYQIIQ